MQCDTMGDNRLALIWQSPECVFPLLSSPEIILHKLIVVEKSATQPNEILSLFNFSTQLLA